jgi:hypothetical protein
MKDEARRMKDQRGEPTPEAVAVVWPVAPEAERLSQLMQAKAAVLKAPQKQRRAAR